MIPATLSLATTIQLERKLEPQAGRAIDVDGHVELSEGTKSAIDVTADAQEVLTMLDGHSPLRDVLRAANERLGLDNEEASTLQDETLEVVHELLELGALRFA